MIVQAIAFVLDAFFSLFVLAALMRFWLQALRAPVRNPIAYFSMALTDFAVKPLRRVIPGLFALDLASLFVALIFEFILQVLLLVLSGVSPLENPAVLSVMLFLAFVKLIRLSVYIFMGAVILQAVLSWVGPYHPIAPFFEALTRPFLKPIQKKVPPIGGVDITPVLVLIFLQLVLMLPVAWLEFQSMRMLSHALL